MSSFHMKNSGSSLIMTKCVQGTYLLCSYWRCACCSDVANSSRSSRRWVTSTHLLARCCIIYSRTKCGRRCRWSNWQITLDKETISLLAVCRLSTNADDSICQKYRQFSFRFPHFRKVCYICEMSLGGVHTSESIGGTLRPWTVTFLAYAGTQFAYPRRDGQAKLPVLSRVDETRRTVAFWAPITIRSTYWTTYSKSLSRFCQSCVVADVLCNNSFLISVCFTSAI